MLSTMIFGKKYCRSSQRAQQEIQEQSSNTEEQEHEHEYYIIKKDLSFFNSWTTASPDLIKVLNNQNHTSFHEFYWDVTSCQDMFYDLKGAFWFKMV